LSAHALEGIRNVRVIRRRRGPRRGVAVFLAMVQSKQAM
jgi:hypothetical protein